MSSIEALYILDEYNNPVLEHTYLYRPLPLPTILPLYLAHPSPRPSLIYLASLQPPTLLISLIHDRLLFLALCSQDVEPLVVVEFLQRIVDVLEDFLGAPLLASKIEGSYDVVAQLLNELCDQGIIDKTEPNALRDLIEAPSFLKNLLGGVGLPGTPPSLSSSSGSGLTLSRPTLQPQASGPVIPWRRSNVRHTSNELYVDVLESLQVTIAPSGRPLAAFAHGSIAFTAKVSGVPDLLLALSCPGNKSSFLQTLQLPVFHPCVRLAIWKARPGELSFVPPDGRFTLMGYEVDLLGPNYIEDAASQKSGSSALPKLHLPASADVRTSLGSTGAEFEVRLLLDPRFAANSSYINPPTPNVLGAGRKQQSTSANPTVEEIVVRVAVPEGVTNFSEMRASKGVATYSPGADFIEWHVSGKEATHLVGQMRSADIGVGATLRCAAVGATEDAGLGAEELKEADSYDYTDDAAPYQTQSTQPLQEKIQPDELGSLKLKEKNKLLMPSSATVSFSVKGWLPSGLRIDKLFVDPNRSKGLGSGVSPYKGVKYLAVSRNGVEARC